MENKSLTILKQYWGYPEFRPLQQQIIDQVLAGKDCLALLPTGGGKSLCFQVPALAMEGICIVVSPLIALIKDQVENLRKRGISVQAVYSGMSKREIDIALDNCIFGQVKFLYLSPERLYTELAWERIKHMKVSLFAIDEAHCISEWGHDFRPAYREITALRDLHPKAPVIALSATAKTAVAEDICQVLAFREGFSVISGDFRRENLAYMALKEEQKMQRLIRILKRTGGSSIVYVRTRLESQELAAFLLNHGIPTDFYHAGLPVEQRNAKQHAWVKNQVRVMVATSAFGMGIDKPDVRAVVHMAIPESLEAYFQEAGRAGRDGKKAFAVLLYTPSDLEKIKLNLAKQFPDFQRIQQIYHALCNHFQIAYGAGMGLSFDFDLQGFCKKYQFDPQVVLQAFFFLEKEHWLALSPASFIPSRLKFDVSFQDLYHFQVAQVKYDRLIKLLLRHYGGIFEHYVQIDEFKIARALALPKAEVKKMLEVLVKQQLASYLPESNSARLHILQPRVDYKNLYVDMEFWRSRKAHRQEQTDAIFNYLQEPVCRDLFMQNYFSPKPNQQPCGQCDLCLQRAHKLKQSSQEKA